MLFGLKDARSDDGERRCTQPHTYLGEMQRRLKHLRGIFLDTNNETFDRLRMSRHETKIH
jgi:hypothetical protein